MIERELVSLLEELYDTTDKWDSFINSIDFNQARDKSRLLYQTNPYYRGLMRTYMKYIAGRGFSIRSTTNSLITRRWDNREFQRMFKRIVLSFFIDGEVFVYLPAMTLIKPEYIKGNAADGTDNRGITVDADGVVISYRLDTGASAVDIPAKDMLHIVDFIFNPNERGICFLYPLLKKTDQLDKWLEDRILLNRIRSSIALIREKNTTPTANKTFADAKASGSKTNACGNNQRTKMFSGGSVIDAANITYKFLAPNVDAKDVAEDGRNIGLSMSAMTGFPEFITRGDASNSNYASTMVTEGPAEKEVESWQDFFEYYISLIWEYKTKDNNPEINFPTIISRNKTEETARNKVLFEAGVISMQEWQRREQINIEVIEAEKAANKDITPEEVDSTASQA